MKGFAICGMMVLIVAGVAGAVSSVDRSKIVIQHLLRHDAALPTNAHLREIGLAFLYHPASGKIIAEYLTQQSLALNPADTTVLQDIGTHRGDPEVFTPASAAAINRYMATVHRRNLRKYHVDAVRAYRLLTANAPALPIDAARASVISTAETDAAVIVGLNSNDPEN